MHGYSTAVFEIGGDQGHRCVIFLLCVSCVERACPVDSVCFNMRVVSGQDIMSFTSWI